MNQSNKLKEDLAIIKRGSVDLLPEDELISKLKNSYESKKPLKIKIGFDPTASDLHLGHYVLLRKMKQFQELGHQICLLIGDFTGQIGDPSGRSHTRIALSREEVTNNLKTYHDQFKKFLDEKKIKFFFNSSWCDDMKFSDVIELSSRYTVARLLERDDFKKRFQLGDSISLIEFLYPLIQAYDSVKMDSDLEIGGTDQKFNLLLGRELQNSYGMEQQIILTMPLLVGLDGKLKMSKSYNNYIAINEEPYSMFAKCMSISDELMWDYFNLLTSTTLEEIDKMRTACSEQKENPMLFKKDLGAKIVDQLHGSGTGLEARNIWEKEKEKTKQKKMLLPPNTLEYSIDNPKESISLVDLIIDSGMEKSKSEVRRLIKSGAIKIGDNLENIKDINYCLSFPGTYALKIGKKRYLKING